MLLLKIWFHLTAALKKILFVIIFPGRISFGKHTTFRRNFEVVIEGSGKILIGKNCFFNHYCSLSSKGLITIGDGSIFGENVKFSDHNHRFSKDGCIKNQGFSIGEISIGSDCWVGSNVVFLKGAKVGDNCVIGAGCVIDREIPDKTLVTSDRQLYFQPIQMDKQGVK